MYPKAYTQAKLCDPVVVDSMIDDECGLDGEGTVTGSGEDSGCVGDVDEEYVEFKMRDDYDEGTDRDKWE